MKKIILGCLFLLVSCGCFAQLADKLPDTLTTHKIAGSYVLSAIDYHTDISIKRNHSCTWKETGRAKTGKTQKGKWEIRNDTLFVRELGNDPLLKYRMVMHNGRLYRVFYDNTVSSEACMTRKDYKYYQRQCKKNGK